MLESTKLTIQGHNPSLETTINKNLLTVLLIRIVSLKFDNNTIEKLSLNNSTFACN
jgi:hypothetical protein